MLLSSSGANFHTLLFGCLLRATPFPAAWVGGAPCMGGWQLRLARRILPRGERFVLPTRSSAGLLPRLSRVYSSAAALVEQLKHGSARWHWLRSPQTAKLVCIRRDAGGLQAAAVLGRGRFGQWGSLALWQTLKVVSPGSCLCVWLRANLSQVLGGKWMAPVSVFSPTP